MDQLIGQRRAADGPGSQDLLGRLLAARDPDTGAGLDDAELRAQVLLFLLAGHETTATALTFTLYLLGHHPQAQQRVRDEVRRVVGDRTPTAEDAASLADTTMVVKEAMRLYPSAYGIARRTGHDLAIGGYHLPEGSAVVISTWVLHRHPDHWDRPGVFDPDRFTPQREAARHRYAYLPFGAGPRACIGGSFALLEAVLATVMIVRAYRLQTTPEPVPLTTGITLRPATAVPCVLQPVAAVRGRVSLTSQLVAPASSPNVCEGLSQSPTPSHPVARTFFAPARRASNLCNQALGADQGARR